MAPAVESLFIYPIKSCRGIGVQEALVTPTGLQWDRQWMIVTDRGRFITQRHDPRLSLIQPSLPPEALSPGWASDPSTLPQDAAMTITAPGMVEPLSVPLHLSHYLRLPHLPVGVWSWAGPALDAGDDASRWLSTFLGRPVRLVRFHLDAVKRLTDPTFSPGFPMSFTDSFQILLIAKESLNTLNNKVQGEELRVNRFRPNIFVSGCGSAFEEDSWESFKLAGTPALSFHTVKPASRCKITTVEQETAQTGLEPLHTLGTFRRAQELGLPKEKFNRHEVVFGMHMVCDYDKSLTYGARVIRVGQNVDVVKLRDAVGELSPYTSAYAG